MPFTKEQLRENWQKNKEKYNQQKREKRRLAKLGLAASDQVSHEELKTANLELNVVKEVVEQIERVSQVESEKSIQPSEVSRLTMANPENDVETDAQVSHNQVEQIEFRDKVSRVIPENAKLPNEDRQTFSDVKTKKQVKQKPETIKVSRIVPDEFIDKSNVPRKIVEGQKYVYINGRWEPKVWSFEIGLWKDRGQS